MSDKIYRLDLWRYGEFKIKMFEVVKKTAKTVTIREAHDPGDGFKNAYSEYRFNLKSADYIFYDTMKEAKHAAENAICNRVAYHLERAEELKARLQEVCKHKAINGPLLGNKCVRCDFEVPNPEEYCHGG